MVRTGQGMTNALTSEEVGRARGISNGKKRTPPHRFEPLHTAGDQTTMAIEHWAISQAATVQQIHKG